MATPDSYSDSYIVVEKMIRFGELVFSELEHLLDILEGQELITPGEHKALLELASNLNMGHLPDR
ncbi:MAG TPA: hypothetical protein VF918_06430 [Anaerolineales bacterium]